LNVQDVSDIMIVYLLHGCSDLDSEAFEKMSKEIITFAKVKRVERR